MEELTELNILYEDKQIIVVEKKPNIPVCEDSSKDKDLLTIIKEYIKIKYNKPGNVYLGLVHRLDRPVGGVMVFAKTSKAASRLSKHDRVSDWRRNGKDSHTALHERERFRTVRPCPGSQPAGNHSGQRIQCEKNI